MIDLAVAAVLAGLAALHAYWGAGGFWPGHDESSLVRTVAGFRGATRMPSTSACGIVAVALMAAALWTVLVAGRFDIGLPRPLLTLGGIALAVVFLARGIAAYLPAWRRLTPEQPFARLDRTIYGPLSLILGLLLAIIASRGLAP